MSNVTSNFTICCTYCSDMSGIIMTRLTHNVPENFYSGICNNPNCKNREQYVCRSCYDYSKTTLTSNKGRPVGVYATLPSAKRHIKKSDTHTIASIQYQERRNVMATIDDELPNFDNDDFDNNTTTISNSTIIINNNNNVAVGFDRKSNAPKFYEYENAVPGKGAKYLVGKAFLLNEQKYDDITTEEVSYFMKCASLLTQLTQQQQKLLADILLQTANSSDNDLSIFKNTRAPVSMEDFDHILLSKPTAIIPNLPLPVVNSTDDGSHAYVSLIDLLANELASNTSFDNFSFDNDTASDINNNVDESTEMMTVSQSQYAKKLFWELYEAPDDTNDTSFIMYLWLKEWRDAFDPNSTKSSRNQVWINTFTICPPLGEVSGSNTYFMSISGKSDNHSEIDKIYGDEIIKLSTDGQLFYHGGMKKTIKIKLGKIMTCVDRPERANMMQVGDHAGSFSKYWGFAGIVDENCAFNHLPSCKKCRVNNLRLMDQILDDNVNASTQCDNNKCNGWNVLHEKFSFPVPDNYPNNYDTSLGAPLPPLGREVMIAPYFLAATSPVEKKGRHVDTQKLRMVEMSIDWLKSIIIFSHHNLHMLQPGKKKKYWTKRNAVAYMRSCGISSDLINNVYESATSNNMTPSFPTTWYDNSAMEKCHYAGMHMIFLGHIKSNFEMISTWLSKRGLHAVFGKQSNIYFEYVKKMRIHKYFSPHNLSTSKWGTGNWVSENYVFFARTQKFFLSLPAIANSSKITLANNNIINKEYRIILRFVSSAHAAISRIMSTKKKVRHMDSYVKIYMDCMVEMDTHILKIIKEASNTYEFDDVDNDRDTTITDIVDEIEHTTKQQKGRANFVKSNSLGIFSVSQAHTKFGPLILNWEGGYAGERKIQEVKPLLGIKRENADWQRITLNRLYQIETISKIMNNENESNMTTVLPSTRGTEGLLKIFSNIDDVDNAINTAIPLSGVIDNDHKVYIGYRPMDGTSSRSAVSLIELQFDDANGDDICGICWTSAIKINNNNIIHMKSMTCVSEFAREFCLLLPQINEMGFCNKYYCIGSTWTERKKNGKFELSTLNTDDTFIDWFSSINQEETNVEL